MSEPNEQSEQLADETEPLEFKLPDESAEPKDLALWAGVLVLLTLIVYWPVTTGTFLWRDNRTVTDPALRLPGGLSQIWLGRWQKPENFISAVYQPMAVTANWLALRLTGHTGALSPVAFHVAGLVFIAGTAVLLWFLLRELQIAGAWLIAAVFALHPIHVESVAWITAQPMALAGLFFVGSLFTYLLFVDSREKDKADRAVGGVGVDPAQTWGLYAGSAVLFLLAALSDPSAMVLPLVLLLLLWWRNRLTSLDSVLITPMLIIGLFLWFSIVDLHPGNLPAGLGMRLALLGHAMGFTFLKFFAPLGLSILYTPTSLASVGSFAAMLIGIAVFFAIKSRIGPGPFVAILIYFLLAAASINWFDPTRMSRITDGTAYLAIAPLAVFVIASISNLTKGQSQTASRAQTMVAVSAVVLLLLGSLAWAHTHAFENSVSMWRDTAKKNPESALAETALAEQLRLKAIEDADQSDLDGTKAGFNEALLHAQTALQIDPANAQAELTWADVLVSQGQVAQALPHFERATQIDADDMRVRLEYGSALVSVGRYQPAITQMDQALRLDVGSSSAHRILGDAYRGLHNYDRAIAEEKTALQLDYSDIAARQKLAEMQTDTGKYKEAIENYVGILSDKTQLKRSDLWLAVGKIKVLQNQHGPAVDYLKQAAELDPASTEIAKLLADETEKMQKAAATQAATQPTTQTMKP